MENFIFCAVIAVKTVLHFKVKFHEKLRKIRKENLALLSFYFLSRVIRPGYS